MNQSGIFSRLYHYVADNTQHFSTEVPITMSGVLKSLYHDIMMSFFFISILNYLIIYAIDNKMYIVT